MLGLATAGPLGLRRCRAAKGEGEPASWRRVVSNILLLRSNDRTAVDLVRRDERDFRIGPSRSRQDLVLRRELVRSDSRVEDDEDLVPQGVEPLTLDCIDHRKEV